MEEACESLYQLKRFGEAYRSPLLDELSGTAGMIRDTAKTICS